MRDNPTGYTLEFFGDEPIVDLAATKFIEIGDDAVIFEATGRGTIAGFADQEVTANGILSSHGLFAYMRYGSDAGLPQGLSATSQQVGEWNPPHPADPEPDETVDTFVPQLVEALRANNSDFLTSHLHPIVFSTYGVDQCLDYMANRNVDPNQDIAPMTKGTLGTCNFDADGRSIPIHDVVTLP